MKHEIDVWVIEGAMPAEYWVCNRCKQTWKKKPGAQSKCPTRGKLR